MSEPERRLQPAQEFVKALIARNIRPPVGGGSPWVDWPEVDATVLDWVHYCIECIAEERNGRP